MVKFFIWEPLLSSSLNVQREGCDGEIHIGLDFRCSGGGVGCDLFTQALVNHGDASIPPIIFVVMLLKISRRESTADSISIQHL